MKNNGIEDILIGGEYNKKKKKGKSVIFMFFFLLVILAILVVAYLYFTKNNFSKKELFVKNISNSNIKNFLQSNIYTKTYEKILRQDSVTKSNINFSTTLKNETLNDVDLSKFVIELSNLNDIENKKSFNEAIVNYSGNEIFKLKLLTTENAVAFLSNEINEKYVGVHFDKINKIFEADIDIEKIKEYSNSKKIELTEEEKNNYVTKYFTKALENVPEEKFEVQENIVIKKDNESVDVTSYTLKLSQDELKNILLGCLETLRDDKELLKNFVSPTGSTKENDEEIEVIPQNNNENIDNQNEDVNNQNQETTNTLTSEVVNPDTQNTINPEDENVENSDNTDNSDNQQTSEETSNEEPVEDIPSTTVTTVPNETTEEQARPVININPVSSINFRSSTTSAVENESLEDKMENVVIDPISQINAKDDEPSEIQTNDINELNDLNTENSKITNYIISILTGKKVNVTVAELQEEINKIIKEVKKLDGNGLIVNVYASSEKTEKITITLPNENTLDIEFSKNSETDDSIKITYLYKDEENNNITNGFSLDLRKSEKEANTSIIIEYSFIEDKTINKKVTLNLNTDGTSSSKELKTDAVFTISTNEGETKAIIDNSIKFSSPTIDDELTGENCIFLDELPENELEPTLEGLETKINDVYTNKKDNLNFIDTNTDRNPVDLNNASTTVTREEAKNALITRISNMMQEAIDKNEEFSIQNLVDLKVEGYEVSTTITEEKAVITVDVYTFNLSPEFLLTDAE